MRWEKWQGMKVHQEIFIPLAFCEVKPSPT